MTALELATERNEKTDTLRKRWKKAYGNDVRFSIHASLSADEISALSNGNVTKKAEPRKKEIARSPKPARKVAETEISAPVKTKATQPRYMIRAPIVITITSICLTITGLTVFASWAGAMIGIMFACFLYTAVMVARENQKGATSGKALETVLYLEWGAACLHCFTLSRLLPEFPGNLWPLRLMICVALSGFAAYLSYSAVLTVRNYNAEV